MHPIFANMQNSFANMTDSGSEAQNHEGAQHPFAGAEEAFASPDQSVGKGTIGPQQSGTVTSFSAHMKEFASSGYKPPRRGKQS